MKVKVLEGKGPINGYYGTMNDGQVFTLRNGEGEALVNAGLVEELPEDSDAKPEPKQGRDMTKTREVGRKEEKFKGDFRTKEEKPAAKPVDPVPDGSKGTGSEEQVTNTGK